MATLLQISECVMHRLSCLQEEAVGKVYGTFYKNTLIVLGLQIDVTCKNKDQVNSYPAEVDLCGIVSVGQNYNEHEIKKCLHDVDITDNPVYICCQLVQNGDNIVTANFIINDQVEKTKFNVLSKDDIYSNFMQLRLRADLPFTSELSEESIKESFLKSRQFITSGKVVFNFPQCNIFILGSEGENDIVNVTETAAVGDLYQNGDMSEGTKKKNSTVEVDVLNVSLLQRNTKNENDIGNSKNHGPVCIVEKKQITTLNMVISVDTLAMVHKKCKVLKLYDILIEAAIRNLRLHERTLLENLAMNGKEKLSQTETFHFYPDELGHFFSLIYPKTETDASLQSIRDQLHKQFFLPTDRPIFRRGNRYIFKGDVQGGGPLVNPHEGVRPTDNGGEIALVKGKYSYYHYCQNKMDDNGWGCAYRSLQTLASWFKWQGYTEKPVPTFKDIQKCLVDIGDKPSSFIGSKQWIGSTEVNFVLDSLLGVTSKILYVSSGEEMNTVGPELVNHFKTYGSPIMIGGGVLAHTILGVDYNQQTGNIKFLILDPHYTGSEDLKTIHSKGWCGWKPVTFWDKTSYYNMCLPLVPVGI